MSSRVDLEGFVDQARRWIDDALDQSLPAASEPPEALHEAMRYAVLSGGKRLRPALSLAAAHAVGARWQQAVPVACAVELVHAYSLVHDDLPAMDDDAERRGRPTVHVKFGEAMAILAGDALLTAAFARLAEPDVPADRAGRLVASLALAAGSRGLVGGQVDDLHLREGAVAADVCSIHARKTAALFEFALAAAAEVAAAPRAHVQALGTFGRAYGRAFQAVDDLLDEGRDETSLLRFLSVAELGAYAREQIAAACAALDGFGDEADLLRALAGSLLERVG